MKSLVIFISLFFLLGISGRAQTGTTVASDTILYQDTSFQGSSGTLNPPQNNTTTAVEKKLVFWIHGLSGGAESWSRVQLATEDQTGSPVPGYPVRLTEGLSVDYSGYEHLPIFNLAGLVNNQHMEPWRKGHPRRDTLDERRSFAIGHSQGGIVGRAIRYQNLRDSNLYNWNYGALATFGTPHDGAYLINSSRPQGEIQPWLDDGCRKLTEVEFSKKISSNWLLDHIIAQQSIAALSQQVCDGLGSMAIRLLINSIRKPVAADYAVGAPSLQALDSAAAADSMNVVTFVGIEEEPVLWRVLHTLTQTSDTSLSGSILFNNPFGLDADDGLRIEIEERIAEYRGLARELKIRARRNRSLAFFTAGLTLSKSRNQEKKSKAYSAAESWLATANIQWKRYIGARFDTSYTDGYYCECAIHDQKQTGPGAYRLINYMVQQPSECQHPDAVSCTTTPNLKHYITEVPNDGVVTARSQAGYPGKVHFELMRNTNHMQERNVELTRERLNQLFEGVYSEKFRLKRK